MRKLSQKEAGKLGFLAAEKTIEKLYQERIDNYNKLPKLCEYCKQAIVYKKRINKFCNHSCSANFTNKIRGNKIRDKNKNECLICNNKINKNRKFCSRKCYIEFSKNENFNKKNKKIKDLLETGIDTSTANRIGKKYLINLHNGKCQICFQSEWQNQKMPLVLDHINGNPYDNHLINLRVICHNCNAQTSTFTGRNKGKGRKARAKRYYQDKEFLKLPKD